LLNLRRQVQSLWESLIVAAPLGVFRRRSGQVWRVFDFRGIDCDALLVTAENDIDRPIAYIDRSVMMQHASIALARRIAANSDVATDPRCVDLRSYGYENSPLPTPGFLYGLRCEPLDEDSESPQLLTPRPYCRFLAQQLREQEPRRSDAVDLYEPASENGGSPIRPTAPQPASKTSGKANATAAR
jgi:hypothetical protein